MAEYLGKGTGVTLGTLGTIGFGLSLLNGQNGGGGVLGNILGGGCNQQIAALMAENAALKGENYADKVGKEVYGQSRADNKELRDEVYAFIKPLSDEAANNRVNVARQAETASVQGGREACLQGAVLCLSVFPFLLTMPNC